MAELHDATEEYLEAILAIEEDGVIPLRARLVERLGLSAAAVSETVGRLSGSPTTASSNCTAIAACTSPTRDAAWPPPSCAGTGWPNGCSPT